MKFNFKILTGICLLLSACANDELELNRTQQDLMQINLTGEIDQVISTRVNDSGFVNGDIMGVYIVNYKGDTPGELANTGNHADNAHLTFNAMSQKWDSNLSLYWKDQHTPIDIYGYYPVGNPENVKEYQFSVKQNQAKQYSNGTMGDYEASDFLWGKVGGVTPTESMIRLPLTHRMAAAHIILTEGDGFDPGEWDTTSKQVLVTNTICDAVINLTTGEASPLESAELLSITPAVQKDDWRAIVVPQAMKAKTQLLSITVNGIPYKFQKDEDFEYVAGKMTNFTIRIDKKEGSGKYSLTLVDESITAWENDFVSHDGAALQYLVVDVSAAGKLKETLVSSVKDPAKIRNLKITGEINDIDFEYMRNELKELRALNLSDVKIAAGEGVSEADFLGNSYVISANEEDVIPISAMQNSNTLENLILPDKIKEIGEYAFQGCTRLSGSLILPEGLEVVRRGAFWGCANLTGTLYLPSTLIEIKDYAFQDCGFNCELNLPESLISIGQDAFWNCRGIYGELHLPKNLNHLGNSAFALCSNLTGSLEIPAGVTEIEGQCFSGCSFDGTLKLHDGITSIGSRAFQGNNLVGEINLPKNLTSIGEYAFYVNRFTSISPLPASLSYIGANAFAANNIVCETLELGSNFIDIPEKAFSGMSGVSTVILPENLEYIGNSAFQDCYGITSIICKSEYPPEVGQGAFDGVAKDNFAVEVPESAVVQYQLTSGWSDFKRIVAHHELVCRPSVACALSSEHQQTLIIDAEGGWEIDSKPDWCELSQSSGKEKAEITLTIKPGVADGTSREGDVVFRLTGKDYTTTCHVSQYGYQYQEDEFITLQKATRGQNGGINIVMIGDGYDAKDIAGGQYLADMRQQMEYFFDIEPYATYRDYFNVYTAFALSTESGIGTLNTIRHTRFDTTFGTDGEALMCDKNTVSTYAMKAPTVNEGNINQTLIILVPNSTSFGGSCMESKATIAICPKSERSYPYDARGVVHHVAGGLGFGKFADESIYFNSFISDYLKQFILGKKAKGEYDNIDVAGNMNKVTWSHLIFDPRYSDIVDVFEGSHNYSRGVFRSEQNSCMNNYIPYFSTICRESIVKRIKRYAGETYSFEEFVANDKRTGIETAGNVNNQR